MHPHRTLRSILALRPVRIIFLLNARYLTRAHRADGRFMRRPRPIPFRAGNYPGRPGKCPSEYLQSDLLRQCNGQPRWRKWTGNKAVSPRLHAAFAASRAFVSENVRPIDTPSVYSSDDNNSYCWDEIHALIGEGCVFRIPISAEHENCFLNLREPPIARINREKLDQRAEREYSLAVNRNLKKHGSQSRQIDESD